MMELNFMLINVLCICNQRQHSDFRFKIETQCKDIIIFADGKYYHKSSI